MTSTNTLLDSITYFLTNLLPKFLGLLGLVILSGVALFWFSLRDQLIAQGDVYELPFTYGFQQPAGAIVGEYVELRGNFVSLKLDEGSYVLELDPFNAEQNVELILPGQMNPAFVGVYRTKITPDDQPVTTEEVGLGLTALRFLLNYKLGTDPVYASVAIIKQPNGEDLLNELIVTIDAQ